MEIHFAFNDKHADMFETYCKPSIPSGLRVIEHRSNIESSAVYMKHGYMDIIREKMQLILDSLDSYESNMPIIWSDTDVIFNPRYRRNFATSILSEFRNSKKSILYQREHADNPTMICGGFFIAKKNDFTKNLYSYIKQSCANGDDKHDQDYINEFINSNADECSQHIGTLPLVYASASNGGFRAVNRCQLFHCNCTYTIDEKISMMKNVKSKMIGR